MVPRKPVNISGRGVSMASEEQANGHRCGRCANPYTNGRADCVNAPGNAERVAEQEKQRELADKLRTVTRRRALTQKKRVRDDT